MHALEKILAKASGRNIVKVGEIVEAEVDLAEVNDLYLQVIRSFYEMGGKNVACPERVAFVFDHYSPPPSIKAADNQRQMREFCKKMGIELLFDIGEGVCHQLLAESGFGSVITRDVAENSLAFERSKQVAKENYQRPQKLKK